MNTKNVVKLLSPTGAGVASSVTVIGPGWARYTKGASNSVNLLDDEGVGQLVPLPPVLALEVVPPVGGVLRLASACV